MDSVPDGGIYQLDDYATLKNGALMVDPVLMASFRKSSNHFVRDWGLVVVLEIVDNGRTARYVPIVSLEPLRINPVYHVPIASPNFAKLHGFHEPLSLTNTWPTCFLLTHRACIRFDQVLERPADSLAAAREPQFHDPDGSVDVDNGNRSTCKDKGKSPAHRRPYLRLTTESLTRLQWQIKRREERQKASEMAALEGLDLSLMLLTDQSKSGHSAQPPSSFHVGGRGMAYNEAHGFPSEQHDEERPSPMDTSTYSKTSTKDANDKSTSTDTTPISSRPTTANQPNPTKRTKEDKLATGSQSQSQSQSQSRASTPTSSITTNYGWTLGSFNLGTFGFPQSKRSSDLSTTFSDGETLYERERDQDREREKDRDSLWSGKWSLGGLSDRVFGGGGGGMSSASGGGGAGGGAAGNNNYTTNNSSSNYRRASTSTSALSFVSRASGKSYGTDRPGSSATASGSGRSTSGMSVGGDEGDVELLPWKGTADKKPVNK